MKSGDIYKNKQNENIGLRLERYVGDKRWEIQLIDFIEDRPTRSFVFETTTINKINKHYNFISREKETNEL